MIMQNSLIYDSEKNEFIVKDYIGEGSFGKVFLIENKRTEENFALKTLNEPFVTQDMLNAFINEGEKAKDICHDNVIKYLFFHNGSLFPNLPMYIIMEYANEGNLDNLIQDRIRLNKLFSSEELVVLYRQLIAGMEAINDKLIHRDIKPDNILIKDGLIKISDFGLSKIVSQATRTSSFKGLGCIPYMAPEGWNFDKNTIQMDIYSMGIVFYYLASLKFPYSVNNNTLDEWKNAHLFIVPKTIDSFVPGISPIISKVISKMMEKNIVSRYKNWKDIACDISKTEIPMSDDGNIIESILQRRNIEKQHNDQLVAEKRKKREEIDEFRRIILHQYNTELLEPIKDFINELNKISGVSITFHTLSDGFLNSIHCPKGVIEIELRPLFKENFIREVYDHRFGDGGRAKKIVMPTVNGVEVMAWGLFKAMNQKGFNILLLKNEDSLYGRWVLLFNSHSVLSGAFGGRDNRPVPFPFEFNELEKELPLIRAMHVYHTDISDLDLKTIKEFLGNYF